MAWKRNNIDAKKGCDISKIGRSNAFSGLGVREPFGWTENRLLPPLVKMNHLVYKTFWTTSLPSTGTN
jgi:hypothetical protein